MLSTNHSSVLHMAQNQSQLCIISQLQLSIEITNQSEPRWPRVLEDGNMLVSDQLLTPVVPWLVPVSVFGSNRTASKVQHSSGYEEGWIEFRNFDIIII